jgi:tetratricopeptide (TPR) repeat protein
MQTKSLEPGRSLYSHCFLPFAVLTMFVLCSATCASAQTVETYASKRARAFDLFSKGQRSEALPLFNALATEEPDDSGVLLRLAACLLGDKSTKGSSAASREARLRARTLVMRAESLGGSKSWARKLLISLPEDGHEATWSNLVVADEAMKKGEDYFTKKKWAEALGSFRAAHLIDPHSYYAAQFAGDVYFHWGEWEEAVYWFSLASQIDPDVETAYRYGGDALIKLGRVDQAKEKYIEGVIADPYTTHSWEGIENWAKLTHTMLGHPRIAPPNILPGSGTSASPSTLPDPSNLRNGAASWSAYEAARSEWKKEGFAKEFPGEKVYRRTLMEEADALNQVARAAAQQVREALVDSLDPPLGDLLKLREDGLVEAYVLFRRAGDGISEDYEKYRDANREKLRRYLNEWYIHQEKLPQAGGGVRSPNNAVPTRTSVAPSSIATSKSWDIPIDRTGRSIPSFTVNSSRNSLNRRK